MFSQFQAGISSCVVTVEKYLFNAAWAEKGRQSKLYRVFLTFPGKLKAWNKYTFLNENLCFAQLLGKYHIFHPLHEEDFIVVTTHIEFNIHWGHHEVHRTESYKL